jgi:2'-5' RNA ligase
MGQFFSILPHKNRRKIQEVYRRVIKVLPECKSEKEYHPHMTVGKFEKKTVAQRAEDL